MALQTTHKETTFHVGDTVRVHYRIMERETKAGKTKKSVQEEIKERIQPFEGLVIAIRGEQENKSFTVRRIGDQNVGIERVFPLMSPWIEKIEIKQPGRVRRSKLYYLRNRGNLEVRQVQPEVKKTSKKVIKNAATKTTKKSPQSTPRKVRRTSRTKASSK
ncbi:50S ribosomal protein L19 [Candidatus Roizmanbacteria bacterium]|nr:50S ribosomal protein L19 [Candidatus Roizmanbacteria bacterium]